MSTHNIYFCREIWRKFPKIISLRRCYLGVYLICVHAYWELINASWPLIKCKQNVCPDTNTKWYVCWMEKVFFPQQIVNGPCHSKSYIVLQKDIFVWKVILIIQKLCNWHMSHVMRKLVFAICEQQRCRSASAQSDQHLCFSLLR